MSDNEDYLDSLLKQAATIDNPDSALSRVKELTMHEKSNESADIEEVVEKDIESFSVSDVIDSIPVSDVSEVSGVSEFIDTADVAGASESEELPMDDIESLLKSDFAGEIEIPAYAEEPVIVEPEDVESNISEAEIAGQEAVEVGAVEVPAEEKTLAEEPVIDESTIEEPVIDESTIEEPVTEEITVEDPVTEESAIGELLPEEEPVNYSSYIQNTPPDEGGVMSPEDIDKLINSMSDDVEEIEIGDLDAQGFSESDIDKMLNDASNVGATEIKEELEIDLADLEAFENEFGIYDKDAANMAGDDSLSDIATDVDSLLSEDNSALDGSLRVDSLINESEDSEKDFMNLLNDAVAESDGTEAESEGSDDGITKDKKAKKEKKAKDRKKKKDKKNAENIDENGEGEKTEKKKGKIAKFFEFLTAEEENQEDLIKEVDANENSTEGASGENKEILEEVDKEDGKGKKKKKKKDKKKGKGKDKEDNKEDSEDDSEDEGGEDKKKKKKPKKEKKERKPLELDIDTGKPLSKKNVILIFVLCLSIMGAIILVVNIIPPLMNNKAARDAFYKEQYETTYHNFYGEKLSESDQILFESAEIILKMQHKLDAYNAYLNMGMKVEALDQLLQAVSNYDIWAAVAEAHNVRKQFDAVYSKVISALSLEFSLSLDEAKEIILLPTDVEYSLKCYSIVTGTEYIDPNAPMPSEFVPPVSEPQLEDKLSEEGL